MPLNEGDKAIIREIAFTVGETISEKIETDREHALREHALACPVKTTVERWQNQSKAVVIGMIIGAAVVGSGGTLALVKFFNWL